LQFGAAAFFLATTTLLPVASRSAGLVIVPLSPKRTGDGGFWAELPPVIHNQNPK
jgi:hypothetical protein